MHDPGSSVEDGVKRRLGSKFTPGKPLVAVQKYFDPSETIFFVQAVFFCLMQKFGSFFICEIGLSCIHIEATKVRLLMFVVVFELSLYPLLVFDIFRNSLI